MTQDESWRRGAMLIRLRNALIDIRVEDEGDRVYFDSTNDADLLREIVQELDDFYWHHATAGDPEGIIPATEGEP